MARGLTAHVWSVHELFAFRIPPPPFVPPNAAVCPLNYVPDPPALSGVIGFFPPPQNIAKLANLSVKAQFMCSGVWANQKLDFFCVPTDKAPEFITL